MATRKPGPVKPPTLDLEAKKKSASTEEATTASREKAPATGAKKPNARANSGHIINWTLPAVAGGGAIAGALIAYLIAASGLWPTQPAVLDDTGPAIAALERRLETIETGDRSSAQSIADIDKHISDIEAERLSQSDETNQAVEQLRLDIANIPKSAGENGQVLTALQSAQQDLQSRIETLSASMQALAAGADPDSAKEFAQTLATTNQTLAQLRQSVAALEADINAQITAIGTRLDKTEARLIARAAMDTQTSQTMRLPLAISGMEAALNQGRPFAAELNALITSLPDTTISDTLQTAAATGLPTPEKIANDFANAIPTILAAAPLNPDANWQDNLINQAKSLLALRPTGTVSGNAPDALIARTEAALALPDFTVANQTIAQMPAPMQEAAKTITNAVTAQAEARQFLTALRTTALAGGTAQ